jgi:hypothetical protein
LGIACGQQDDEKREEEKRPKREGLTRGAFQQTPVKTVHTDIIQQSSMALR